MPNKPQPQQSLVSAPAHLEFCSCCGKSARITLVTGQSTREFYSKKLGHEVVTFLQKQKHIVVEEGNHLHASLDESALDETDVRLDFAFLPEEALTPDPEDEDLDEEEKPQQWLM